MSVFVENGVSVLRSSAGHVLKFKGSESDPVLLGAKLEDCDTVGPRLAKATRPVFSRRLLTMVADFGVSVDGVVECEPAPYVERTGLIVDASAQWLEAPVAALDAEAITHVTVETATVGDVFLSGTDLLDGEALATFTEGKSIIQTEKVKVTLLDAEEAAVPAGEGKLLITLVVDSFIPADVTGAITDEYSVDGYVEDGGDPAEAVVFVAASANEEEVRTATSDANGAFTITGLRAGRDYRVYQIDFADEDQVYVVNENTVATPADPLTFTKQIGA